MGLVPAPRQDRPPDNPTPKSGTFAWAVDVYQASPRWTKLAASTRKSRASIIRRYVVKTQANTRLSDILSEDLEKELYSIGGFAAVNELKALKPIFAHAYKLRIIATDPTRGLKMERPETEGFRTADADEIEAFQERWPVGTVERLVFDLALYTGAARVDLVKLGRRHIKDGVLTYRRQKSKVEAHVPVTKELRAVIDATPHIAPAFIILNRKGKPYTAVTVRPDRSAEGAA